MVLKIHTNISISIHTHIINIPTLIRTPILHKIEIHKVSLQLLKGKAVEEVARIKTKTELKIILLIYNNKSIIHLICLVVLLVQTLASTLLIFLDKDRKKITFHNRLANRLNKKDSQGKFHNNRQ